MNIIYACDDICDLCEYLRLLEKSKKKEKNLCREQKPLLSAKGAPSTVGCTDLHREQKAQLSAKSTPSTRAKYLALGEGVAPTPNGGACHESKRAFG
jgi:hypothetical protein